MQVYKIAEEIKTNGFCISVENMDDEHPDKWVVFGVWFYLKRDFRFELDWREGTYYFYTEKSKEKVASQLPPKSLDSFSAEKFLANDLLANINLIQEIKSVLQSEEIYITSVDEIMEILSDEEQRAVLYWFVEEVNDYLIAWKNDNCIILTTDYEQRKVIEYAKEHNITVTNSPSDYDEDESEIALEGFEKIDLMF